MVCLDALFRFLRDHLLGNVAGRLAIFQKFKMEGRAGVGHAAQIHGIGIHLAHWNNGRYDLITSCFGSVHGKDLTAAFIDIADDIAHQSV